METILFQNKLSNGYIKINVEGIWIFEHKYIVEEYLNRNLTKEERIHHINSIKTDNRINNLVIFPTNKAHVKFHLKLKQFGMNRTRLRELNDLKLNMLKEKKKNE